MAQTKLEWSFDGIDPDEFKVYRSDTPMDPEALPAELATVTGDLREYIDTTVVEGNTYYFRVGAVKGTAERVSEELEHVASDPRSDWEKFIDALNPTFWIRMSETSGTVAADSSGNGYDGTFEGGAGVTLNQAAIYSGMGPSARFGAGYCRIPHNAALNVTTEDFVVGVAFKRDGTTGRGQYGKLLWKTTNYTNGHANYLLQYTRDTNKIAGRTSIQGGSDYFGVGPTTTTFANATPYLVALRRISDKISLWVNGAKEAEATLPSGAGTVLRTGTLPVDIMGGPDSTIDPVVGFGDEAFLIKGTVDDAAMAAMWAARVDA